MVSHYQRTRVPIYLSSSIRLLLVVTALVWVPFTDVTCAQSDPIPAEIKDLKMGVSQKAVIEKIKSIGTYTTEPVKKEKNRNLIVWVRSDIPYYKTIEFQFTEKDRLYLIRFRLKDSARADYHSLKKTVFKDYDFSWERPQKLRLRDREMLLYGPEEGMRLFYIEFTHREPYEKSFELFDRSVSATDRPEPILTKKKKAQQPAPATDAKKPEKDKTAPTDKKPVAAPAESQVTPKVEKTDAAQQTAPANDAKKPEKNGKVEPSQVPAPDAKPVEK